ncbi:N-acetylgalactosamine kinase isoform X2 [Venturia canescens]|nr:N-acetylgalactosamine kinase isoform X2 [Venturia canescens]
MAGASESLGSEVLKDTVPITKWKDCDDATKARLEDLADSFSKRFNVRPDFIVRVPGRVNLIGEHIDYCGYAVCPMAIEQHMLVAVAVTDSKEFRLANVMDDLYQEFVHDDFSDVGSLLSLEEQTEKKAPSWHKYFLCGIKGAMELMHNEDEGYADKGSFPKGMLATVWGNIPANSGLSSSSALVSAAVLATTHASQCRVSKEKLATVSAQAERYIGTQGGGMDQAIAFLAKPGTAKLIEFNPLRATDVNLPPSTVFVIAHSLACHNKASSGDFNLRVTECRLAAQVIAKLRDEKWQDIEKLSDLQDKLVKSHDEMARLVLSDLHEEPYSLDELCEILETTQQNLESKSLVVRDFEGSQRVFKLRQRALHVFQEAARVLTFRRVSEDNDTSDIERIRNLGNLMSKSHTSLDELYECSHPYVNELVQMAMDCGAMGARLTGAGWGGCVVAITTKSEVSLFVRALRDKLKRARDVSTEDELDNLVFPTEPNRGADLYDLS